MSEQIPTSNLQSPALPTVETNPWLHVEATSGSSRQARKQNEILISKNSDLAIKSQNALKRQQKKTGEVKAREKEDAEVLIDMNDVMIMEPEAKADTANVQANQINGTSQGKKKRKERHKKDKGDAKTVDLPVGDWAEDSDSEVEEQERVAAKGSRSVTAFAQRELVARAFAGDNVVQVCCSDPVQRWCSFCLT